MNASGVYVTRLCTTIVRIRPWSSHATHRAPFDGCSATGKYGHTWKDAHGTHDLVEIPLTAKGRRFFAERAVARDVACLARASVFKAVRYAQRPFTSAPAAEYLAERVDLFAGSVGYAARRTPWDLARAGSAHRARRARADGPTPVPRAPARRDLQDELDRLSGRLVALPFANRAGVAQW